MSRLCEELRFNDEANFLQFICGRLVQPLVRLSLSYPKSNGAKRSNPSIGLSTRLLRALKDSALRAKRSSVSRCAPRKDSFFDLEERLRCGNTRSDKPSG